MTSKTRQDLEPISADDLYLFGEGSHFELYSCLGAQRCAEGTRFAVWAPAAQQVSVVGDFNGWDASAHPMSPMGDSGVFQLFIPDVGRGTIYKYSVDGRLKADPYGFHHETAPKTGSIVWDLDHEWGDADWMAARAAHNSRTGPISIYEAHLGSFMRVPEEGGRMLSYREIAPKLADHALACGFTHVELMPIMEHPFEGSWGYQVTGYFAPTSRMGTPQDFMFLVDHLHQRGLGVILDWVPAHFPTDGHGLGEFDGTHLYEHADPRQGFHPDWKTYIFNYGRHEVQSFLISSAAFFCDRYHVDGLRVDGVASMLYLDYSRDEGEWIPNAHGGRENLDAVRFLRRMNEHLYARYPGIQTYAEESTAWPGVSRPTSMDGLGFGFKWDMGFMHDSLRYMAEDPVHRRYHHDELTFRALYAYDESFVLPLSHDEVVHGKGSLLGKMPGDEWQRFANLRLLYAYMWATPGKKLLFMGSEFAQIAEWDHDASLDWDALQGPRHAGLMRLVSRLNALYREHAALHALDCDPGGFEWLLSDAREESVVATLRTAPGASPIVCAFNFTPVPRHGYRIGVPHAGLYRELLNTDAEEYAGSGRGNLGEVMAEERAHHERPATLALTLPPLGAVFLTPA
ncbi:MAG: 1,4-alpha-glucan branching protein GlgB [Deltaproteobacteria bacterium]|nr:1,4-alpha-glucan branching protein GlgB [Deltaproteobacteria bacterium]